LAHAWTAGGALVADDDDVALLDLAGLHRCETRFLAVEHPRRALEQELAVARELDDAAFRGEVAVEDAVTAARLERGAWLTDDLLAGRRLRVAELLEQVPSRDGRGVLDQPGVPQIGAQHARAAGLEEVRGGEASRGLHVGDDRRAPGDLVEDVDLERQA